MTYTRDTATTNEPKIVRDRATEIQAEALRNGGWPDGQDDDLDADGYGPDDPSTDATRHPANRPDGDQRRKRSRDATRRQAAAITGSDQD